MNKKLMRNVSGQMPRVTIGMPVWNGEQFIRQALDSLLAQDFRDFELIISDNASTDNTEFICKQYMKGDRRIKYYRNEYNIGSEANFKRVLELATAPYFMWASYDDLWEPSYILKMFGALNTRDTIIIAGSNSASIDANGMVQEYYDNVKMYSPKSTYARAYRFLLGAPGGGHSTFLYGLMRTAVIKKIGLVRFGEIPKRAYNRAKYATDKLTLFRLIFEGEFYIADNTLYYHRDVGGKKEYRFHMRLLKGMGLPYLKNLANNCIDYHRYYSSLRRIVFASDLKLNKKVALFFVSVAQELTCYLKYCSSMLVRLFS